MFAKGKHYSSNNCIIKQEIYDSHIEDTIIIIPSFSYIMTDYNLWK